MSNFLVKLLKPIVKATLKELEQDSYITGEEVPFIKPNKWNMFFRYPLNSITLKIEYTDEIQFAQEKSTEFNNISELMDYVSNPKLPSDIKGVKGISLFYRFVYKNQNVTELITFTKGFKVYKPEVILQAFNTIKEQISKYPEHLL